MDIHRPSYGAVSARSIHSMPGAEITPDFFRRSPVECARSLIGCYFRWNGCEGRIVETEAYAEHDDPACHTWTRPSARNFIACHEAGTAYVYLNYGVHWLFNVLTKGESGNGFVLFRALEPYSGMVLMQQRRQTMDHRCLCSGPGKLTKSFGISGIDHEKSFLCAEGTGIRQGKKSTVVTGGRVGISRALDRPWRFGAADSQCLSRKF